MGYREIFARIAAGQVGGAFVFYGPEEYVKDRALEALTARVLASGLPELNATYLEGERANAAEIRRAAETLPMMSDCRLILVRDYSAIASGQRGGGLDTKKEQAELELLFADFPSTACLVFLLRAEPDRVKAVWKLLAKHADLVEFARLSEEELAAQVAKICKQYGCAISREDARFLIRYCGDDLEVLSREAAKACAIAPSNVVGRAGIEAVCVQSQESKVFQFVDKLFAGQNAAALVDLRAFTAQGESLSGLISLIERQARLMAAAKAAGRNAQARELAGFLGAPPFAVEAAGRTARGWRQGDLTRAVELCAEADRRIKQGLAEERGAVELLAMELLQLAAAQNK